MSHKVTEQEIIDLKEIDFQITQGNVSFSVFLNDHFPDFAVSNYLKAVNNLLGPLANTPLSKEISFHENPPPMVIFQYFSDNHADDLTGLAFSQAFILKGGEIISELDYLRLPLGARKKGISKKLLNLNLQQWQQMGVAKVRLEAALSNGGLIWAKAFFSATDPKDVKVILDKAGKELPPDQFDRVKRVFDNYYSQFPDGKSFPMVKWSDLPGMDQVLRETYWKAELDLTNSDIFSKFKNYVA